jgi:hypothetical protein
MELWLVAWLVVAQEWEPYQLNDVQKRWFQSVHPKHGNMATSVPCCSTADGHPTQAERRQDGWYVPSFENPQIWIKVPEDAYTVPSNNPVGTAVVWWRAIEMSGPKRDLPRQIRCFVPQAEY